MAPIVLVRGGGFAASCWDLMVEHLDGDVLAVDLPGRGAHPAPLGSVTIASAAASVVGDIDAAGYERVALVGHSLAGCTMPAVIGHCRTVDLDAAHMCMISKPRELAGIIATAAADG